MQEIGERVRSIYGKDINMIVLDSLESCKSSHVGYSPDVLSDTFRLYRYQTIQVESVGCYCNKWSKHFMYNIRILYPTFSRCKTIKAPAGTALNSSTGLGSTVVVVSLWPLRRSAAGFL